VVLIRSNGKPRFQIVRNQKSNSGRYKVEFFDDPHRNKRCKNLSEAIDIVMPLVDDPNILIKLSIYKHTSLRKLRKIAKN